MSTYVPNIGSVKPYEAEALDAKLQKRRKDQDGAQSRKEHSEDQIEDTDTGQILSVQALILFLEDFLESRLGSKLQNTPEESSNAFDKWFQKKPSNANDAAQAYRQGARTSRGAVHKVSTEDGKVDLSHIYGLIRDLRDLRRAGVHALRLAPDTDFIDGIALASRQAYQDLQD